MRFSFHVGCIASNPAETTVSATGKEAIFTTLAKLCEGIVPTPRVSYWIPGQDVPLDVSRHVLNPEADRVQTLADAGHASYFLTVAGQLEGDDSMPIADVVSVEGRFAWTWRDKVSGVPRVAFFASEFDAHEAAELIHESGWLTCQGTSGCKNAAFVKTDAGEALCVTCHDRIFKK